MTAELLHPALTSFSYYRIEWHLDVSLESNTGCGAYRLLTANGGVIKHFYRAQKSPCAVLGIPPCSFQDPLEVIMCIVVKSGAWNPSPSDGCWSPGWASSGSNTCPDPLT